MLELFFGKVYANKGWLSNCTLRIEQGKIHEILADSNPGQNTLDYLDYICSPGFVDMHIHGAFGKDTMDGEIESLLTMSKFLVEHGTTSFLPTTMTAAAADVRRSLEALDQFMGGEQPAALCLGAHLEGPFINPAAKGAQIESQIQNPSLAWFETLCGPYLPVVKSVTLAPEQDGAEALIRFLVEHEILPIIGHTKASYQQARESFEWGVRHATHLYNAMTGLHHRDPGVVGACLEDDRVSVELIADLVHVHPAVIRVTLACKGPQNIALVTDAMSATGLQAGKYQLGGQDVWVKDGEARLVDGTLAGSVLTQDQALRNLAGEGIALEQILEMLTATPARILGVSDHKGEIRVGADADLTILTAGLDIQAVYIAGEQKK